MLVWLVCVSALCISGVAHANLSTIFSARFTCALGAELPTRVQFSSQFSLFVAPPAMATCEFDPPTQRNSSGTLQQQTQCGMPLPVCDYSLDACLIVNAPYTVEVCTRDACWAAIATCVLSDVSSASGMAFNFSGQPTWLLTITSVDTHHSGPGPGPGPGSGGPPPSNPPPGPPHGAILFFNGAPMVRDLLDVAGRANFLTAFGVALLQETSAVGMSAALPAPLINATVLFDAFKVSFIVHSAAILEIPRRSNTNKCARTRAYTDKLPRTRARKHVQTRTRTNKDKVFFSPTTMILGTSAHAHHT